MNTIALPSVTQLAEAALTARFEQFATDLLVLLGKAQRFMMQAETVEIQAELARVQKEFAPPARFASYHDLAVLQGRLQRDVGLIQRSIVQPVVRRAETKRTTTVGLSLALTASAC
jgi:hypothetical protein